MFTPAQDGRSAHSEEDALKAALAGGFRGLWQLPADHEAAFQRHRRQSASLLLRKAIYGLIALYLLVVVPIFLFSNDPAMPLWEMYAMAPIGVVLAGLWIATRLPALEEHIETVIALALFTCLLGTISCSMRLDGQYFGQMAAYETIYILVVAFTILQLAPRVAVPSALAAFTLALLSSWGSALSPSWLEMLLYFVVPLLICTVTGLILDTSERRNFLQQRLLNHESQRMAEMHAEAERNMRAQQLTADYLTLISGNLTLKELFARTLRFLVEHTGAQVAVAYHLSARGKLRRVATWAVDASRLGEGRELEPEATLMGPALASGETLHLQNLRADYLPVDLGMGSLPCAALLVIPVVQAGRPLAVIELGRITPFGPAERARAEAVRTHLAYAVLAANARGIAVGAAAG
ncbi:MAG: hypothetical protein K0S16_742 [Moraxellaceae bacterium]|jgi:hypothetical protein|nr:hypothetical protein [Moraxellaceae bacterium]